MALHSNTLAVIRQRIASMVGDLIMGTADSGTSTTLVDTELANPGWADDYFNNLKYRIYIYAGTNIGEERHITDWDKSAWELTNAPAFTAAITTTSKYELHKIFFADDYLKAINQAIASVADKYILPFSDETTVRLTSTEDNLGNTIHTWEYDCPTNMTHIYQITMEDGVSGKKLTGTVSGAFTAGETITGGTSGATGELSYGPAGGTYIRVRKVSGTFVTGETATGGTSNETCSAITAVDSETAGMNRWLPKDVLDPRHWDIVKAYPSGTAELRLNKSYLSSLNEDLYLRLDGYRRQPAIDDDTDIIYLPEDWICWKAITFLPHSKIESNKLDETYRLATAMSLREPHNWPHPKSRRVVE